MSASEVEAPAAATVPGTAHAVLLFGAEGADLGAAAMDLAARWLCVEPSETQACGACRVCSQIQRGQCPDLLIVEPSGASAWISVRAIAPRPPESGEEEHPLPLQTFLRTPPLTARHKVVMIRRAERLSSEASNALLKILEEPEPHAKFILTTTFLSSLQATVVSRCILVAKALPTLEELCSTHPGADPEVLQIASGSLHPLSTILEAEESAKSIASLAARLPSAPRESALALSDSFRRACEGLDAVLKSGARAANAEGWRLLSEALRAQKSCTGALLGAVEAHRLITGNGNSLLVADAFFTRWTGQR